MSTYVTEHRLDSPIDVLRITGVRIHGDEGVTPVDPTSAHVVITPDATWLVWQHGPVERAVNTRHIVELFSDEPELVPSFA